MMSNTAQLLVQQQTLSVQGVVNFDNVATLRTQGEAVIKVLSSDIHIDLQAMEHTDSAIASLLCCWTRYAKEQGKVMVLQNPSLALVNLLKLYGIKNFLMTE